MKENLYVCVKNPFSLRDMDRMGIEPLEKLFNVHILDCTEWLMPVANTTSTRASFERSNLFRISSFREFTRFITGKPGGFAIDYVGPFSVASVLMLYALKRNGTRTIVIDSGAYPSPDVALGKRSLFKKLLDSMRQGVLRQTFKEKCAKWLLKILPDMSPDYAFVAGNAWKDNARYCNALNHIPGHSFDYEVYQGHRLKNDVLIESYAVYLDEMIVGHDNNAEQGLPEPASVGVFFPALRKFFDEFESMTGIPVVIAAYPYANLDSYATDFGGRKVIRDRTAELVRDASLVFAHASTSISFAVLWRKPIIFLTSGEISQSWYQPWIDAPRILLNARLHIIDDRFSEKLAKNCLHVDADAYLAYERLYLKDETSPDVSLWQRFELLTPSSSMDREDTFHPLGR